jgi:hypothetical protein
MAFSVRRLVKLGLQRSDLIVLTWRLVANMTSDAKPIAKGRGQRLRIAHLLSWIAGSAVGFRRSVGDWVPWRLFP